MEFAQIDSQYYCGIDLHSRTMFATIMDKAGKIYFRQNMENNFDIFLKHILPYLPDLAVGLNPLTTGIG